MTFKSKVLIAIGLLASVTVWAATNRQLKAQSILNGAGVLTLPTSTDTIVGRATTDTLTNKTISGASNTLSNVNMASQVTGTLPVANGGTGATTLTSKNVILGEGTSAVSFVAPGTSGNVLTSNGTTWTSAASAAGSVVSPGTVRIVSAYLTNGGSCAVSSQDGSWISSVTDPGAGRCGINIAGGTFSATPRCTVSLVNSAGNPRCTGINTDGSAPSSTFVEVYSNECSTATGLDHPFYIICVGAQ